MVVKTTKRDNIFNTLMRCIKSGTETAREVSGVRSLHRLSARRQEQENQKPEEKTTFTMAFFNTLFGVLFVCSLIDVG